MSNKGRPTERRATEKVVQALRPDAETQHLYQISIQGQAGPVGRAADPVDALLRWKETLPAELDLAASVNQLGVQRVEQF